MYCSWNLDKADKSWDNFGLPGSVSEYIGDVEIDTAEKVATDESDISATDSVQKSDSFDSEEKYNIESKDPSDSFMYYHGLRCSTRHTTVVPPKR